MSAPHHLSLVGAASCKGRGNYQVALSILIVRERSVLLVASQRNGRPCWGPLESVEDVAAMEDVGEQVYATCRRLLGVQVCLTGSFDGHVRNTSHRITAHASLLAASPEDPILKTGAIWTENSHAQWFTREEVASMGASQFVSERAHRLAWEWLVGGMSLIPHH
jgi:hypothetical protein